MQMQKGEFHSVVNSDFSSANFKASHQAHRHQPYDSQRKAAQILSHLASYFAIASVHLAFPPFALLGPMLCDSRPKTRGPLTIPLTCPRVFVLNALDKPVASGSHPIPSPWPTPL
ncbi:hypothetical protein CC78DRAFT_581425 [Lojkania enalia]|uniref:Uncharacterized protein n=1 Tax=Lojkania enalia TaxID=147567 RepID=A0A9P4KBQ5_9PLEO|nr:hypothetical protein CC78DRAFT_581425 [Didymosphaeria enalia]